jgi:hypothetical protein
MLSIYHYFTPMFLLYLLKKLFTFYSKQKEGPLYPHSGAENLDNYPLLNIQKNHYTPANNANSYHNQYLDTAKINQAPTYNYPVQPAYANKTYVPNDYEYPYQPVSYITMHSHYIYPCITLHYIYISQCIIRQHQHAIKQAQCHLTPIRFTKITIFARKHAK